MLGTPSPEALRLRRQHEREARREERLQGFFDCLPLGGALLLIASGYARKIRPILAGLGLLAFAAHYAKSNMKDFKIEFLGRVLLGAKVEAEAEDEDEDEGSPIKRITDTILLYAVRDGASQIRLRAGIGIQVHYLIKDEWQEQMKMPSYVWNDLCVYLQEQSDDLTRPVIFQFEEKRFEFFPDFRRNFELPLETLILTLQSPLI